MDITQGYYKPYKIEDHPTDEQILDYVLKFAMQYSLIDEILKKSGQYTAEQLIGKSNEELQEIRKLILINNT